jgi:alkanesulfonate monooxygenase SsuD/methylene tetrahydromethanopterin reductase-like flavin-dependent oxidoreductase (luciferase family)
MTPFSVLDFSPITQGSDAAHAFRNTLDLARHAEGWGYRRFWLAEHHGMPAYSPRKYTGAIAASAAPICNART